MNYYSMVEKIKDEKILINSICLEKDLSMVNNLCKDLNNGKHISLLCIHHFDLDGYGVYLIIRLMEKLYPNLHVIYKEERTKVTSNSLTPHCFNIFDYIFIGDLSFDDSFTKEILESFDSNKIGLLDHHSTATSFNEYDFCYIQPASLNGPSDYYLFTGTSMTWLAFKHIIKKRFNAEIVANTAENNQLVRIVELISRYDTYYWKMNKDLLSQMAFGLNLLFKNTINKYNYIDNIVDRIITEENLDSFILTIEEINQIELLSNIVNLEIDEYIQKVKKKSVCINGNNITFGYLYYDGKYGSEIGNTACEKNPDISFCMIIDLNNEKLQFRSINTNCVDLLGHLKDRLGNSNFGGHPFACGASNIYSFRTKYHSSNVVFSLNADPINCIKSLLFKE